MHSIQLRVTHDMQTAGAREASRAQKNKGTDRRVDKTWRVCHGHASQLETLQNQVKSGYTYKQCGEEHMESSGGAVHE